MEQSKKARLTKTKGSHRNGRDFEGHRKSIHGMDMPQAVHQKLTSHVRSSYSFPCAQDQNTRNTNFSKLVGASISDRSRTCCITFHALGNY